MINNLNKTNCCDSDSDTDPFTNYAIFIRDLLLIVSNFFLLPAIYLAIKCKYRGEAILYFLTMLCSSFYHLCDNSGKFQYCVFRFQVLQFCDFYSAIMTMWATAALMSDLSFEWRSALHLTGSLVFAGLLQTKTTGFWSFVVPGFSSIVLLLSSWGYQYFQKKIIPSSVSYSNLIPGTILSLIGAILFASQTTKYAEFYSYTHSGWHICMSLAITFLLPKSLTNHIDFRDYSDSMCVLSIGNTESQ